MLFSAAIRAAARRAPALARLIGQRDDLLEERRRLTAERDDLRSEIKRRDRLSGFVPPGHFYSPIPSWDEIERDAARLFPEPPPRTLPGIDLREADQMTLVEQCVPLYDAIPFQPAPTPGLRFWFENGAFSYADALFLSLMLRRFRPRRVIEVGSGHSSCVTLDVNERFLGNAVETIFIEPYPQLLHSLLRPGDADRVTVVPERLQDVPLDLFSLLDANDILFIDSTHVGNAGSDVTAIFEEILPSLRPGVLIHFHDIFYPFQYPRYWFDEGRAWNGAYLLRSFLQYNTAFRVEL